MMVAWTRVTAKVGSGGFWIETEKGGAIRIPRHLRCRVWKKEELRNFPKCLVLRARKTEVSLALSGKVAGGTDFRGGNQECSFEHVRLPMPCLRSRWRRWVVMGCVWVQTPEEEAISTWMAWKAVRMDETSKEKWAVREEMRTKNWALGPSEGKKLERWGGTSTEFCQGAVSTTALGKIVDL